jgi:16S rRNA (uracil1498-N3)-methyltransferase
VTRRRWIADQFDEQRAWLLGSNAAHLARVLRARPGQEYDIVCGTRLRLGTVVAVSPEQVEFSLSDLPKGEKLSDQASPEAANDSRGERELMLLTAIYKFDRMEWAIEKCTELGVTRIVPVIARRTDSHLAAAASKRVERWRRIAHEAAQQSRRIAAPLIEEPLKLKAALAVDSISPDSISDVMRLLLNENERSEKLRDALAGAKRTVTIAVGPEGGWAEEEIAEFARAGWRSVTLGSTILRAETAAIAALAAVAAILG